MSKRFMMAIFFVISTFSTGWSQETQNAETLFKKFSDRLYQVKLIEQSSGETYSCGSGFQITAQGHIATNYHVVASLIQEPDSYSLKCIDNNGLSHPVNLIDIDIVNDLAIIQLENTPTCFFKLKTKPLNKGARLFATGNPYGLGMTIVEGTYNGNLHDQFYKNILFSGALNPGMSGGPTIDDEGYVIGINRAMGGNDIGFLVPAHYLDEILKKIEGTPDPQLESDFKRKINIQLTDNQNVLMDDILSSKWASEPLGDVQIPKIPRDYLKGWANNKNDDEKLYKVIQCEYSIPKGVYVNKNFESGMVSVQYYWLETEKLNGIQFYNKVQDVFNNFILFGNSSKEDLTDFKTRISFLEHDGMNWKYSISARKYLKYPGLYDVVVRLASLDASDQALVVIATLTGFSMKNTNGFIKKLVENITWKK